MRWEFRLRVKRGRNHYEFILPVDSHTRKDAYTRVLASLHILMTNFEVTDVASRKAGTFDYLTHKMGEGVA